MKDVFNEPFEQADTADPDMIRATDVSSSASTPPAQQQQGGSAQSPSAQSASAQSASADPTIDGHVCPFCGVTREITDEFDPTTPCPRCTLADTPTTRNATKARVGPWHVRQVRNPWAPGMRFETLLALIKRGQVTRDSIVRGPTTHQLWKRASEIKGLSREFGMCHSCGGEISPQTSLCPHCNRLQEPPANPDMLVDVREAALRTPPPNPHAMSAAAPAALQMMQQPTPAAAAAPAPRSTPEPAPAKTNGNGNGNAHGNGKGHSRPARAHDDAPKLDIGSGTHPAAMADPEDMLSAIDDPADAALARQITSRPPQRTAAPRTTALRPARAAGVDDALLTPQELAAAFQLNFSGNASGAPDAAAPGAAPAAPPRRRGSKLFACVLFLLLVGGGAAVLFWLRPDLREQATAWAEQTTQQVKTFVASRTSGGGATEKPTGVTPPPFIPKKDLNAATAPASSVRPGPIDIDLAPPAPRNSVAVAEPIAPIAPTPAPPAAPRPQEPETAAVLVTPPAQKTLDQKTLETPEPPRPAPAASQAAPAIPAPAPKPVEPKLVEPRPAEPKAVEPKAAEQAKPPVDAQKPPVVTSTPSGPPGKAMSMEQAEAEARKLWSLAFDAEQNQDYVEAVACYEKIKKLPSDVQPLGLEVRLSLARKMTQ